MSRNTRLPRAVLISLAFLPMSSCQPRVAEPTALVSTTRSVLFPSAIASLSSAHGTQGLPGQIRLGDPFGRSALYLKFPNDWRPRGRAVQAFLTLTPSDAEASDGSTIVVEVWRIRSDWQPEDLHAWSDKPELSPPTASAAVTSVPPRELRIDVTELARFAAEDPARDFGLALLSRSGSGSGAAFATGMAGGVAPRLEVYVR